MAGNSGSSAGHARGIARGASGARDTLIRARPGGRILRILLRLTEIARAVERT